MPNVMYKEVKKI